MSEEGPAAGFINLKAVVKTVRQKSIQLWPYSKATRGNIDVAIKLV
jgi:hypothetical protein